MKPQCNSAADCLRELARVMDQFGISDLIDAVRSRYVKTSDLRWNLHTMPHFMAPETWSFAIAEIEGKPVFMGDELWCGDTKFKVAYASALTVYGVIGLLATNYATSISDCSWNPPKPKTVMVEMLVEDAQLLMGKFSSVKNIYTSCKKALEELK